MTKKLIILSLLMCAMICGCKKLKNVSCDPKSQGRIIGYDPCRHYGVSTNNVKGKGFVIEIDNNTFKDTVVNYGIPNGLFQFPAISQYAATNGWFLYSTNDQNKLLIKFNYRFALESEKTAVVCLDNIYVAPFLQATKGKEIFLSCVSINTN